MLLKILRDSYIRELLEEQRKKTHTLALGNDLQDLQEKVMNIFGPFSVLWDNFEQEKEHVLVGADDTIKGHICATETLFEQTGTTIAQVMNSVSYQRRTNAVSALYNDAKKAKNTLHEQK